MMHRDRGYMAPGLFKRVLDEIVSQQLTGDILFHLMGEPLLHPDLLELLRYAVARTPTQHLVTNGSHFTDDTIAACYDTGVTNLDVSYYTPSPSLFKLRQAHELTFTQYQHRIQNLVHTKLQRGSRTHLRLFYPNIHLPSFNWAGRPFTLMHPQRAVAIVRGWAEFVAAGGVDPHPIPYKAIDHWNMRTRQSVVITDGFELVFKRFHNWHNSHRAIHPAPIGKCARVLHHEQLGILWNGDVVLCCGDYEGHTTFGNIAKTSLTDLLQSENYQTILRRFAAGRIPFTMCQECLGGPTLMPMLWQALGKYYAQSLLSPLRTTSLAHRWRWD